MKQTLQIRTAGPDDSVAYGRYLAALFAEDLDTVAARHHAPTDAQIRAWLADHGGQHSVVFFAQRGQELLGTLKLTRVARPSLDHAVGLGLNVRADVRGQGIGRQLLQHALAGFEQALPIERIELEVFANNPAALHLYRGFGFIEEGRKVGAVKKGAAYVDILLMAQRKNAQRWFA